MKKETEAFIIRAVHSPYSGYAPFPCFDDDGGLSPSSQRVNDSQRAHHRALEAVKDIAPQVVYEMAIESLPPDEFERLEEVLKLLCETRNLNLEMTSGERVEAL